MENYKRLLKSISYSLLQQDIDDIKYQNFLIEYPIPDLITLDWKTLIQPPSLNSSKHTLKELQYLQKLTSNRSPADIELVYNVDNYPAFYLSQTIKELDLDPHSKEISEFYAIVKHIMYNLKYLFNRPRPYQLAEIYDLNLNVINTKTHNTPSYPSGHTVYTSLYRDIMSYFYPQYRSKFDKAMEKTMMGRMIQGVHFPSDNFASEILTKKLFNHLYKEVLL